MYAIGKREFLNLFKGIKSILVVSILFTVSYYSAKFSNLLISAAQLSEREAANIHTAGLLLMILVFGLLFVMGLSHDIMNRETLERTIRFLVTRTSRSKIIMGKFLGTWMFWFVCLVISFLLISIYSHKIDFLTFFQTVILITYQISLTILLSIIISKPGMTMFLSIVFGLIFPIFGFMVYFFIQYKD